MSKVINLIEDFDGKKEWFKFWNRVAEKFFTYRLPSNEWSILMFMIRYSWGYRRKEVLNEKGKPFRWLEILEHVQLSKSSLSVSLHKLSERNILHVKKKGKFITYEVNGKPSTWKELVPSTEPNFSSVHGTKIPQIGSVHGTDSVPSTEPAPIKRHIKDKKKKTLPLNPPKPASRKKPKQGSKKESACSLPAGFRLSLKNEKYAVMKGIDIEKVDDFFDAFVNWANAKGIECVDWEAQFKTHCDNAPQYGKQYLLKNPKRR